MIEEAKFTYSLSEKGLEKQTKKQLDVLNFFKLSNKIDELIHIDSIFPQNQLNHLIIGYLEKSRNYKIVSN